MQWAGREAEGGGEVLGVKSVAGDLAGGWSSASQVTWQARFPSDAPLYGLGEKATRPNLAGQRFEFWHMEPSVCRRGDDPIDLSVPSSWPWWSLSLRARFLVEGVAGDQVAKRLDGPGRTLLLHKHVGVDVASDVDKEL